MIQKANINGPVNVVRLEGEINGIKKVLYSFFDYHIPLYQQTECESLFSVDIDRFLSTEFDKMQKEDTMYDFFLEIQTTNVKENKIDQKKIYILQLRTLFQKIFKFDLEKNEVAMSEVFKNVRFHYMDIRDYLDFYFSKYMSKMLYLSNVNFQSDGISIFYLQEIIEVTTSVNKIFEFHLNILDSLMKEDSQKVAKVALVRDSYIAIKKLDESDDADAIIYLYNKMLNNYKNEDVKRKLHQFAKNIINRFKDLIKICKNIIYQTEKLSENLESNVVNYDNIRGRYTKAYPLENSYRDMINIQIDLFTIPQKQLYTFSKCMDLFFFRRFLDKDYITNAISYTGAAHSCQYVLLLIKYFDFKITHTSYTSIPDINKLNSEIKKQNDTAKVELFLIHERKREKKTQCSDMSSFPEIFS